MTTPESPYGPSITPVASAPIAPVNPHRRLGAAALVLSLSPVAIAVVSFIVTIVAGVVDSTSPDALGWLIIGAFATVAACVVLGGLAIVLGIVAIVRNRGRGLGIAGMAIAGIGILVALPFFLTFSL